MIFSAHLTWPNAPRRYLDFYLDLVATSDNISLLYHLAMKAKTVRDAESHTYSEVCLTLMFMKELRYSDLRSARICMS
jgi:hypothetical protein